MEIKFDYMVMEKLELINVLNGVITASLIYIDDCYCKTYKNIIILRNIEENRKISRCCELKKKCNIIINAFDRSILKINLSENLKNLYSLSLDLRPDP